MTKPTEMKKANAMDEKELGPKLFQWVTANFQFITSGAMAASIAFARIAYEYTSGKRKRSWGASVAESVLCGLFALGLVSGLELFGLPQTAATFVGGMVGFIGVDKLKEWLEAWGDKKVDKKADPQTPQQ